jgi:hypothetical protein
VDDDARGLTGVAVVHLTRQSSVEEVFGFRRDLLDASRSAAITVLDVTGLADLEPALVRAISSAVLRMQGSSRRLIAVGAVPSVARVLTTHCPFVEISPAFTESAPMPPQPLHLV